MTLELPETARACKRFGGHEPNAAQVTTETAVALRCTSGPTVNDAASHARHRVRTKQT